MARGSGDSLFLDNGMVAGIRGFLAGVYLWGHFGPVLFFLASPDFHNGWF
jgi:hypothetical protein